MALDLFWCVLIGYAFGNILSAEVIGLFYHKSLFEHGSGNPGMTNTIKVLGKTAGILVLLGDILKTIAAVLLCDALFPSLRALIPLYAGLGVTLGHCFPLWHHFLGGKGVAVAASAFILYWPLAGIIALLCGGICVLLKLGLKKAAAAIDAVFLVFLLFRFSWITFIPALLISAIMAALNMKPNRLIDGRPRQEVLDEQAHRKESQDQNRSAQIETGLTAESLQKSLSDASKADDLMQTSKDAADSGC